MKILYMTVGGSFQPLVTAIKSLNPDRVIYVCSGGPKGSVTQIIGSGTPCLIMEGSVVKEKYPAIPIQVNMVDRFDKDKDLVVLEHLDDIDDCYTRICDSLRTIRSECPDAAIKVDYTGGTKTMSIALFLAAIDCEAEVYLTTGLRKNLVKVNGGESTGRVGLSRLTFEKGLTTVIPALLKNFDYTSVVEVLQQYNTRLEMSSGDRTRLLSLLSWCRGFDLWDRFDHLRALGELKDHFSVPEINAPGLFLKRIIASRALIDSDYMETREKKGHGYEVVEDLLLNAERCASRRSYDDAVGRLYRALELFAQLRLKISHQMTTGNIEPEKIPENLRATLVKKPGSNKIQTGLKESYDLLSALGDSIGMLYLEEKNRLLTALEKRNLSLFAHGFRPISEDDYRTVGNVISGFIAKGIATISDRGRQNPPVQFPVNLAELA